MKKNHKKEAKLLKTEPLTVRKVWDLFIEHMPFLYSAQLFKGDDNVSAPLREQFLGAEVSGITDGKAME